MQSLVEEKPNNLFSIDIPIDAKDEPDNASTTSIVKPIDVCLQVM